MYVLFVTAALLSPGAAPPKEPDWAVKVGLTSDQVQKSTAAFQSRGYMPVHICAYNAIEANRFAVVYQKGNSPAWDMDWGMTTEQFLKRARNLYAKGYVTACLSGSNHLGSERLSDLWLKQTGSIREATYGLALAELLRQIDKMKTRGFRPICISSYRANTFNVYAVIWEKGGPAWEMKYGLSAQELQDALDDLSARGYRPLSISGLNTEGVVGYCAVWEKRKGPAWEVRYGQTQDELLEAARAMAARGYRPKTVVGYNTSNGDRFTSIWEKEPSAR